MGQDRSGGKGVGLTHEHVSLMLGTRRVGVTVATHEVEGRGPVKATRKRICIIDREGLEAKARGLHGVPVAAYACVVDNRGPERVA